MTKEELEKEAEKYADTVKCEWENDTYWVDCRDKVTDAYLAGAEPREKQIQIDAEQIRALQKQNGELTDRLKELEAQMFFLKDSLDQEIELHQHAEEYIKSLEAQIEKMKQDLDTAREEANRQEQWELYSVLNGIYNDNFEVITSVSN